MNNLLPCYMYMLRCSKRVTQTPFLFFAAFLITLGGPAAGRAQPQESDYYRMETLPLPNDMVLEVGGMELLPDGRLAVCTRRGEVWLIDHYDQSNGGAPGFTLFAEGLHEPLGIAYKDGAFFINQREELTKLTDTDGDDRADQFKTIYARTVSGNYHEYAFGPIILPDGEMLVTYNLGWTGSKMGSMSKWGGWMATISPDGELNPLATGMRSPAGFGLYKNGDIFYAENQGGWVGSGFITHVKKGAFMGHPSGLKWSSEPESPSSLHGLTPGDIPDTGKPKFKIAENITQLETPSVWFPHGIMGTSTSDILYDTTGGGFGPFSGQLFVGDQGQSKIMRVNLEKVKGEYQGAVFAFREGFQAGVTRLAWGAGHSLLAGLTSRGWGSPGGQAYGLQQLIWTGKIPFEIKKINATPDGFKITFTKPADRRLASDPASYSVQSFTYKYHSTYGSPVINLQTLPITGVRLTGDQTAAYLSVEGLREKYIHQIKAAGVLSGSKKDSLLHNTGYYTLKNIPEGARENQDREPPQTDEEEQPEPNQPKKHLTDMPPSWTNGPDQVITINAIEGLRYDKTDFTVSAGANVKLIFNNPTDLLHNLLITTPGNLVKVAKKALNMGLEAMARDYVPDSDHVLYHTSLLEPNTNQVIYFTAPATPDEYPYVCTFPGHYQTMQGTMTVTQ